MKHSAIAAAGHRPVVGFKTVPEDFRVYEEQGAAQGDAGADAAQRAFLIEKRGLDTPALVALLAQWAQVPEVEIGYAGRKDRQAITAQWLTVPAPAAAKALLPLRQQIEQWRDSDALPPGGQLRLLQERGQRRKLRVGELAGNRFLIRLRALDETGAGPEFAEALAALRAQARQGIPNAFGPQRFGQSGLADARRWAQGRAEAAQRGRQRRRRRASAEGWHLSVLRAYLFNQVLAERVRQAPPGTDLPGDEMVDGVPSGPLWGRGRSAVQGRALDLEQSVLSDEQLLCDVLEHAGPTLDRRALWMVPRDLVAHRSGADCWLGFRLAPGSYATVLLDPFFELRQPNGAAASAPRAA